MASAKKAVVPLRRLTAKWTANDASEFENAFSGDDEMLKRMSEDIQRELDKEILHAVDLTRARESYETWKESNSDNGFDRFYNEVWPTIEKMREL